MSRHGYFSAPDIVNEGLNLEETVQSFGPFNVIICQKAQGNLQRALFCPVLS